MKEKLKIGDCVKIEGKITMFYTSDEVEIVLPSGECKIFEPSDLTLIQLGVKEGRENLKDFVAKLRGDFIDKNYYDFEDVQHIISERLVKTLSPKEI